MTHSPPGPAPTIKPRVEQISAPDLSSRTKQMRFLVSELGVTRQQAHGLLCAYERDHRDPLPLSASITAAEVAEVRAEDFRRWVGRRKGRLRAADTRIGGPVWRTHT